MSTNTKISCDWPSAKALVGNINEDKLNVTDVVAQCINVCDLAFESKRNEVFGPGVMISMLIEGVLFPIFGVLFPAIVWFLNKRSTSKVAPSAIFLRKIQSLVLETTAVLIISLFVTAIVTSRKASSPSILELTFLSSLLDFQFWSILGVIVTQSADEKMNGTQVAGPIYFAYFVLFFAQLVTSSTIKIPNQSVYKTLAKECHKQRQFISAISTTSGAESAKFVSIGFGAGIVLVIVMGLVITYREHFPSFLGRPFKRLWRMVPTWLKEHTEKVNNFVIMCMYAGLIPDNFYKLQKLRKLALQTMPAGQEEWGYGQTTAILLWLPFVISAIKETMTYMTGPEQSEESQAETGYEDQDESLPSPPPPPYDFPHPATQSTTATPEVASKESQTDGIRRTSSGIRATDSQG